jgi:hypothetical protein
MAGTAVTRLAIWLREHVALVAIAVCALATLCFGKWYLLDSIPVLNRIPAMRWRWVPLALLLIPTIVVVAHRRIDGLRSEMPALSCGVWLWFYAVFLGAVTTEHSASDLFGMLAPYFLAGMVYAVVASSSRLRYRDLQVTLTILASILSVSMLLDAEGWWPIYNIRTPAGLLHNRNFAAEYLAILLPICMSIATGRRRVLLLLLGVALAWTRCRTAWLAGASSVVLFVITSGTERRREAVVAALTLVAAVGLALVIPNRLHWREAQPYAATAGRLLDVENGSGAIRLQQHLQTPAVMKDHWLGGLGPGNWQRLMARRGGQLAINRIPHSEYLRALADGGLAALAALLFVLACAAHIAWTRRRNMPDALPFVVALCMIGVADAPFHRLELSTVAFAMLALLAREGLPAGYRLVLATSPT